MKKSQFLGIAAALALVPLGAMAGIVTFDDFAKAPAQEQDSWIKTKFCGNLTKQEKDAFMNSLMKAPADEQAKFMSRQAKICSK